MATIPDAKLLCISTGYAQTGALYDAHKEHYGKDEDDILVWQADTASMNPTISQAYIDKEIEKDPEAARAEWLGLFREDVSAAFPLELIEACIIRNRLELRYSPHVTRYFGFADPSGGRHDAFTLAVVHQNYGTDTIVLDLIRIIRSPFDPSEVVKEYSQILQAFGLSNVIGDNYGGEWPKAEFAKHGINYELCEKTKSELYLATIPLFTSKRVELLDIEKMKNEFRRLERRRGRSGKDSIDHPSRESDDIANAVTGALSLVSENAGQFFEPQVVPSVSILAEPPVSIIDKVVDKKGTRTVAQAYLDYLYTPEGQEIAAKNYYRPRLFAVAKKYFKITYSEVFAIGLWSNKYL